MIRENKTYLYYYIFLFLLSITINLLFIYNIVLFKNIENTGRIILLLLTLFITIFFNIFLYKTNNKKYFTSLSIIFFLYLIILIIVNYNLNNIYEKISKIASNGTTYSTSIVTYSSNNNEDINKIDKIGIIDNKDSIEGYVIPNEIINNNDLDVELVYYDDYITMINDLLNNNIEYIFLPTNYLVTFDNIEFDSTLDNTKIIYTQGKDVKIENNKKKLDEPFTILLMGVDSTENDISNSSYNGDALMILTYNPNTYTATMLSIPRDSYMPISCLDNRKNKITHAAWYNESCIIDSLNNTFDINIDYYIKVNFKGLVNIVDNLGGIEVNVPYSFCESDSNRLWGENTVYVKEGVQKLTGEQALALSRNRHPWPEYCSEEWTNYYSSDIIRGQNQQLVLNEIINKVKDIKSLDTIYVLLDTVKNNLSTNLTTDNILSFYNASKDISKIKIQKLYLNGYDEYIYDYDYIKDKGTKLTLYDYIPYQESISVVSKAMKDNLNGSLITTDEVIGEVDGEELINLMPNLVGKTYYEVVDFCNKNNIELKVNYVSGSNMGLVTSQSVLESTDLEGVNSLTISVVNEVNSKKDINTKDNSKSESNIKSNEDNKSNKNENSIDNNIKENTNSEKDNTKNDDLDPIIGEIFN